MNIRLSIVYVLLSLILIGSFGSMMYVRGELHGVERVERVMESTRCHTKLNTAFTARDTIGELYISPECALYIRAVK